MVFSIPSRNLPKSGGFVQSVGIGGTRRRFVSISRVTSPSNCSIKKTSRPTFRYRVRLFRHLLAIVRSLRGRYPTRLPISYRTQKGGGGGNATIGSLLRISAVSAIPFGGGGNQGVITKCLPVNVYRSSRTGPYKGTRSSIIAIEVGSNRGRAPRSFSRGNVFTDGTFGRIKTDKSGNVEYGRSRRFRSSRPLDLRRGGGVRLFIVISRTVVRK